jgi:hypothetical protein
MIATIVTASENTAQVLFLIAAIVFGVAFIVRFLTPAAAEGRAAYWGWTQALIDAGLCLTALGLMWAH